MLGRFLQDARVAARIELDDLEPVVGSKSSLREIERGHVRTRVSRLRPWLEHLGIDPDPVLERFAAVIAPEPADGRNRWKPRDTTGLIAARNARRDPPPLPAHEQAALGAELWGIRVRANLDRQVLADAIGVSRVTIWFVEHGARRPSAELVDAWLDAAGGHVDREMLAIRWPGRIAPKPSRPSGGAPRSVPSRANGRGSAERR